MDRPLVDGVISMTISTDYVVVGRPITQAADPAEAAREFKDALS